MQLIQKKIKDELSWEPRHKFEDALSKTIDWYVNNLDWCKKISKNANFTGERIGISNL